MLMLKPKNNLLIITLLFFANILFA